MTNGEQLSATSMTNTNREPHLEICLHLLTNSLEWCWIQSLERFKAHWNKLQNQNASTKLTPKLMLLTNSRGSSFAMTVSPVSKSEPSQSNKQSVNTINGSGAFTKPCMFCNRNHSVELCGIFQNKPNNEKVEFLKAKELCFGCLQWGHMSKSCQKRMSYNVCKKGHPTVLHIQTKENQQLQDRIKEFSDSKAVVSLATGSHTGASTKDCALAIVPVKVKLEKGT